MTPALSASVPSPLSEKGAPPPQSSYISGSQRQPSRSNMIAAGRCAMLERRYARRALLATLVGQGRKSEPGVGAALRWSGMLRCHAGTRCVPTAPARCYPRSAGSGAVLTDAGQQRVPLH